MWLFTWIGLWVGEAAATVYDGEYLGLSFTGDGSTPSALALLDKQQRTAQTPRFAASANEKGDAGYALPLPLPPALAKPSLALRYSSTGSAHTFLSRGWTWDVGMSLSRPTGQAAAQAYADTPGVHLVQGGGLQGLLVPDGNGWRYVATQGTPVVADYDAATLTWTLHSQGVTTTLLPNDDIDWLTLGIEPTEWHIDYVEDTGGNAIDFDWSGNRLDRVLYGGNINTGDLHYAEVTFHYALAPHVSYLAQEGTLEVIADQLQSISLSVNGVEQWRYELSYTLWDQEELLTEIQQVESSSGIARILATLTYSTYTDVGYTSDSVVDPIIAAPFAQNCVTSSADLAPSETWCSQGLFDWTGDGMIDALTTDTDSGSPWQLAYQNLRPAGYSEWEDLVSSPRDLETQGYGGHWSHSSSVEVSDGAFGNYTFAMLMDVDSDGRQDLIVSDAIPQAWDYQTSTWDSNANEGSNSWWVYYGNEDGLEPAQLLSAPFAFPRIGYNPKLPDAIVHPAFYDLEGGYVDLLDMNGDGWQDVVAVEAGQLRVWYKKADRNLGWETSAVDLLNDPALLDLSLEVGSLESSRGYVGIEQLTAGTFAGGTSYEQEAPKFESMEVRGGFRDINSDGLVDFISTQGWSNGGEWKVWLGNGVRFEANPVFWPAPQGFLSRSNEGSAQVEVCSIDRTDVDDVTLTYEEVPWNEQPGGGGGQIENPLPGANNLCSIQTIPIPQQIEMGLQDMDGDGRVDFVDALNGQWWQNLGDGFSGTAQGTPSWFPTSLSASQSYQTVVLSNQYDETFGVPQDSQVTASLSVREQIVQVVDFDQDRMPDVWSWDPLTDVKTVTFGDYPRPGLLLQIEQGTGATTDLTWRSSSELFPSGQADIPTSSQKMHQHKDVLQELSVFDPVTSQEAIRSYGYWDGYCEKGLCWGFETYRIQEKRWDTELQAEFGRSVLLAQTLTTYELHRDFALPLQQTVFSDVALSWLPGGGGFPNLQARYQMDYVYDDFGPAFPYSRWLIQRDLTEYGEDPLSIPRVTSIEVDYNAVGLPTEIRHLATDSTEDITVNWDYVSNADGSHWVPIQQETTAYSPLLGTSVLTESGKWYYDNLPHGTPITKGWMSREEVCGGRADSSLCAPSQKLNWFFYRTVRGAIHETQGPAGQYQIINQFDFGDALPVEEINALAQTTWHTYDVLGREIETTDPNGMKQFQVYDAFGRVTETSVQGVGGAKYLTATHTYFDQTVPNYVQTVEWTYNSSGGSASRTSYQVQDGFGEGIQTWKPNEAGTGFLVGEAVKDPMGNAIYTTYPHRMTSFSADFAATVSPNRLMRKYYDAFGQERLSYDDVTQNLGSKETYFPEPGLESVQDSMGYLHETHYDSLGRIEEVWQGHYTSGLTLTGKYSWDGRDRLIVLEDAASNQYQYAYDGVGRMRQVWRQGTGQPTPSTWYSYVYDGPYVVSQYEGDLTTGTEVVRWTYDDLGRSTEKDVLQGGVWKTWTWSWDSQWVGARSQVTDPQGVVDYTYASGTFGKFGHPTGLKRTWSGGLQKAFTYRYDFEGRVVEEQWPSGAKVQSTYTPTGWLTGQKLTWNGQVSVFNYQYDGYGLRHRWWQSGANGFRGWMARLSPVLPLRLTWSIPTGAGRVEQSITWAFDGAGKVSEKTISPYEPLDYSYDAFGRVAKIQFQGATTFEEYTYDEVGNPLTMYRQGEGTWNYTPANQFHEIGSRSLGGASETQSWDSQGRLWSWHTLSGDRNYQYDGMGRLVSLDQTIPGQESNLDLHYGVDDDIVLEEEVNQGVASSLYRFQGWQYDSETGEQIESVLPMVRLSNQQLIFAMLEPDGHALATYDANGNTLSFEVAGAYGVGIPTLGLQGDWALDGLSGGYNDRSHLISSKGVRHVLLRDGTWLQPEPLLYTGLATDKLKAPLSLMGVYAAGDAHKYSDRGGYALETGWDIFNIGLGVASFASNVASGNWGAAAVDAAGVIADVMAAATPLAPGGAGTAIKTARAADKVGTAVQTTNKATDALKGSATFHKYEGVGLGSTGRHVTVEIKDAGGKSLGEFHQTGVGKHTLIEPVKKLSGTRTTSSKPYALEDPTGAAKFGTDTFPSGKYVQGKNDCVTGACAVANQGSPVGGPITPSQVRSDLEM